MKIISGFVLTKVSKKKVNALTMSNYF